MTLRRYLAMRRLAKLVKANRDSFACEQYRRRRAAMLKHTRPQMVA